MSHEVCPPSKLPLRLRVTPWRIKTRCLGIYEFKSSLSADNRRMRLQLLKYSISHYAVIFKGHSLFFEDSQVLRLFVLAFCPMIYFVVPLSTEAISLLLPPVTEAEFRNYVTFPWLASRNSFRSAFEQTTLPNSVNKILITRVIKLFKIQKPFKLALLRIISTPLEVSKTKHWKKNLPGSDLGIRQYHGYSICRHKHVWAVASTWFGRLRHARLQVVYLQPTVVSSFGCLFSSFGRFVF